MHLLANFPGLLLPPLKIEVLTTNNSDTKPGKDKSRMKRILLLIAGLVLVAMLVSILQLGTGGTKVGCKAGERAKDQVQGH